MKLKWFLKTFSYLVLGLSISSANAGAYEDWFRAVQSDDAGAVKALLQRGMDPNLRDEQGQVGLFLALRGGAFAVAEVLLQHPQLDPDATNSAGETPLMMAALHGLTDWEARLLARGARLHQPGWSPVLYAAGSPEPRALALLLDRGAPVDARSPNGTTPLMMAARYGSEASVQLLLERGADPRLRNDRQLSAAEFARLGGREKLAERLAGLAR
jgi:ankyrin repeat protein